MITPKIIHSFPIWLPQTQTWMFNQVSQLQHLGCETHIVCEQTENLNQFRVKNIHCLKDEPIYKQVWDKAVRQVRLRRHLDFLVSTSRKIDAQIIHSHFGNIGWDNLEAIRKLDCKHVVTFYGLDVNQLPIKHPIWRKRYIELFSEVDTVLCEGSYMANSIRELGCPSHKVKVQHLGVALDEIPFRPRSWQLGEPLRVLLAASFREKKGLPYAIAALGIVAQKQQIELTIIGDASRNISSQREKIRILSELNRNGLRKHTKLLGYQSYKSMLEIAYDNHLFLQPSITAKNGDTEGGAPVTIIEMLASGMLSCSTEHCDIPEVFGPGAKRLLVPERDINKLASCILKLLDKPSEWAEISREIRLHIEKEYDQRMQAKKLLEYYMRLGEQPKIAT